MWTIQLLGQLALKSEQRSITRFRTQKAASLLAYLAFHSGKEASPRSREILIEMLWPEAEPEAGRANLSNALFILRHCLEPPGVPPNSILQADRFTVRLNASAVTTDVVLFEQAVSEIHRETLPEQERPSRLLQAAQLYDGPLLPGYYEEWIGPEATRLGGLFLQIAGQVVPFLLRDGALDQALAIAQRASATDPYNEEATLQLMQVLVAMGQTSLALREYRHFEKRLQEELDEAPSEALQVYVRRLKKSKRTLIPIVDPPSPAGTALAHSPPDNPLKSSVQPTYEAAHEAGRSLRGDAFVLLTTSRFFGREAEIDRLHTMLSAPRTRLVTITGVGGTGKTRLALEAAARLIEATHTRYQQGLPLSRQAIFVPLAEVTDALCFSDVLLRALGQTPSTERELLDQVAETLAGMPDLLLVLDNFEQLVESGADTLHRLLARAPGVKYLVTSRQTLQIEGEQEFHLAPLATTHGEHSPIALLEVPSVALFVDRAQAVRPDFQLTEHNAATVATLCDYLEGIPLAIELAAARLQILSVAKILEQISANRLDFLTARKRDAVSRHRTLRSTLEWSYHLLSEPARLFLAELSVFRGGWTLEAAASICQSSNGDPLMPLAELRDGSLINVLDEAEGLRFTMLETVREYAVEQLQQAGRWEAVRRRHREYFLDFAEEAASKLNGPEQALWLDRLDADHDNLRAALDWCQEDTEGAERGLRLAGALQRFWSIRSYWTEGRKYLHAALAREGAQERTQARANALNGAGMLASYAGDHAAALPLSEECLAIRHELGDKRGVAGSLHNLGLLSHHLGDIETAQTYYEQALALNREVGNRAWEALNLQSLGFLALWGGDPGTARSLFEQSLAINRDLGNREDEAFNLSNLGTISLGEGDSATTRIYFERSLNIHRELGDRRGEAHDLTNLGSLAASLEDVKTARSCFEQALSINREIGHREQEAMNLQNLGGLAKQCHDYTVARSYFEASLAIHIAIHKSVGEACNRISLGSLAVELEDYTQADLQLHQGLQLFEKTGFYQDVEVVLVDLAQLAVAQHRFTRAGRLYGAAEAQREHTGASLLPNQRAAYERQIGQLRDAVSRETFDAAWEAGKAMTLDQAIRYALEAEEANA